MTITNQTSEADILRNAWAELRPQVLALHGDGSTALSAEFRDLVYRLARNGLIRETTAHTALRADYE